MPLPALTEQIVGVVVAKVTAPVPWPPFGVLVAGTETVTVVGTEVVAEVLDATSAA